MKTKVVFLLVLISSISLFAQDKIDYTDPKEVAEKFLEYFYKGEWFDAAKYCGAEDCQKQIEIMMTKMALDDVTQEEGKCFATIDSIKIDNSKLTGTIFFTKKCSEKDKGEKRKLMIKKSGEKWLIEYVFKRDKYL